MTETIDPSVILSVILSVSYELSARADLADSGSGDLGFGGWHGFIGMLHR